MACLISMKAPSFYLKWMQFAPDFKILRVECVRLEFETPALGSKGKGLPQH